MDPEPVEGRQARRKARTAAAVLEAAEHLFLTVGFDATTIEQLADAADVSPGSIYAHFGSKAGVYAALVDRALALDAAYCDQGWDAGATALERMVGISEGYLRFALEHPNAFRIFRFPVPGRDVEGPLAEAAARVEGRVRSEIARMGTAIGEIMEAGFFRAGDPRHTAILLWSAWDGLISAQLLPRTRELTREEFDAVIQLAREVFIRGLANDPVAD